MQGARRRPRHPLHRTGFRGRDKQLTGGKGVDVVYDSVGKTTFHKSLDCLRPRGMMVTLRAIERRRSGDIDPLILEPERFAVPHAAHRSANYISDPAELQWRAADLFKWIDDGQAESPHPQNLYTGPRRRQAQRDLEAPQDHRQAAAETVTQIVRTINRIWQRRRASVLPLIQAPRADAFLTTALPNVRYLTGFTGSNAALLLTADRALLFTDPRYQTQAPLESDCEVKIAKGPLLNEIAEVVQAAAI